MNVEQVEEGIICNWCEEPSFPNEDMLVQSSDEEIAYYHLRCIGKLCVLRIEGVLPPKIFRSVVTELNSNIVEQLDEEE